MSLKQKGVWSFLLLVLAIGLYFGISTWMNPANPAGTFTVEIINAEAQVVEQDTLSFADGDTLYDVLLRHYEVGCANQNYELDSTCSYDHPGGKIILALAGVTTDWTTSYFAIYRNDTYVSQGVSRLKPQNGDVIRLIYTPL